MPGKPQGQKHSIDRGNTTIGKTPTFEDGGMLTRAYEVNNGLNNTGGGGPFTLIAVTHFQILAISFYH